MADSKWQIANGKEQRAAICYPLSAILPAPHRDPLRSQKFLYLPHRKFSEMKKTRGEDGICFAFAQDIRHMPQSASPAAGHDGHAHRFTDPASDNQVET